MNKSKQKTNTLQINNSEIIKWYNILIRVPLFRYSAFRLTVNSNEGEKKENKKTWY